MAYFVSIIAGKLGAISTDSSPSRSIKPISNRTIVISRFIVGL